MSSTMKAIAITALGGVDVLQAVNAAVPSLDPHDVLVRVHAVSINPVETKIRNGTWAGGKVQVRPVSCTVAIFLDDYSQAQSVDLILQVLCQVLAPMCLRLLSRPETKCTG
jgi:hypothetical protein